MACSRVSRCLRQMREGTERLLEGPHGLAVGRPRHGLLPGLSAVRQGLVPHFPPQGMVGQPFHLLGHPLPGQGFEDLDDPRVQGAPPLLEETAVGHFVGEGVLEGILALGKEPGLVQELGGLEVGEAAVQCLFGRLGDRLEEGEGHLQADHRGRLQEIASPPVAAGRCGRPAPPG